MRRVVEFVVAMLPLDASGRRAVDETLADWRHEASEAQTGASRLATAVRGFLAVVVAVSSVVARDLTSLQTLRIVGVVAGSACLMATGFTYRNFERYAAEIAELGVADANLVGLWASMLPAASSFCVYLALLAPPVRRVTTRSLMGPCLVLMVMSAVNLGWVTPAATQWFRQANVDIYRQWAPPAPSQPPGGHEGRPYGPSAGADGSRHMPRGIAEFTVFELVREVRSTGARAQEATMNLSSRATVLAMVPICLLLGVHARRLGAARRWKVGSGLLAWVTFISGAVIAVFAALAGAELFRGQLSIGFYEARTQFSVWLVPVVCGSMAFALARVAHWAGRDRDDGQPIAT